MFSFRNVSTKFGSLSCNISEDIGCSIWVKKIAVAKPGTSNFDGYGITCILNNYYQQIKTIICLMASKSMDWFPFEMIVALKRAVWLSCISHSWCSKWPPSARTHARRRWRHCLTASSIMSWSKRSHSSISRSLRCAMSRILVRYTRSCSTPHIL